MKRQTPTLAIIIPCYNESEVIPTASQQLLKTLNNLIANKKITADSFIYFIDDGSSDDTWKVISSLHQTSEKIKGLKLSRNFGQQNALYAGLMHVKDKTDCIITIDADLQDSILVIEEFIDRYQEGYEIVYGVRKQRQHDGFFKKTSAHLFYGLMRLLGAKIVSNHSDFRLMSKRVLNNLEQFSEFNLFLRGLITLIGFRSTHVYYDRGFRIAGKSKYPLNKLLAYSVDGITAFSIAPLRFISLLGILCFISSFIFCIYVVITVGIFHQSAPNGTSTILPIYFLSGIQLLTLGILGEYLGKVYQEIKARPRFIIDTEII